MTRRSFLPVLAAPLLAGSEEALEILTALASALSEGNPIAFLQAFDRDMQGYASIEASVTALTSQTDIVCSIEILKEGGDDSTRSAEVDWFMQLRSKSERGPVERRRQIITVKVAKRNKKWKIVAFDPAAILAPQTVK
ncbi:MAG: hypothetical protein M3Z36_00820 [Acidobacteriota bacterium]|nr:hypothetical protein [Acidobacteriota bacterium]